jgi:hypothetical protein
MILQKEKKYVLVYKTNYDVIEDYIDSLCLFDEIYEFEHFIQQSASYLNNNDYVVILTNMWLTANDRLSKSKNIIFLNVEHLSEQTRMNHMVDLIRHGISVADFSDVNIKLLKMYAAENDICTKDIAFYHFPYQFHVEEQNRLLICQTEYEYDIGIINANPKIDGNVINLRTTLWEKLKRTNLRLKNIMGWKNDRDQLINKCKIILNIHNFEVFTIFEHIRCDRLLFSKKLVVSQVSLDATNLDIYNHVIWINYDDANIIDSIQYVVDNFERLKLKYANETGLVEIVINRGIQWQNTVIEIERNIESGMRQKLHTP